MGVSVISEAASAFPAATKTGEAQSAATAAPIKGLLHEIGKRMGPSSKLKVLEFYRAFENGTKPRLLRRQPSTEAGTLQ
jgi:hypothetical protein